MSGPDAAIAAALVEALKAAPAVSALVAARVHADARAIRSIRASAWAARRAGRPDRTPTPSSTC